MIANELPVQGYDKDLFPDYKGESFDCGICLNVAINPKECKKCGSVYCGPHIDDWLSKKNECPMGCVDGKNNILPVQGALAKLYRNLDIRCKFPNCKKVVKLCDLPTHEVSCQLPKCFNYDQCSNTVKPDFRDKGVCDSTCYLLKKIKESNSNWAQILNEIKQFQPIIASKQHIIPNPLSPSNDSSSSNGTGAGVTNFRWDTEKMGTGMEVSFDKKNVFLKENAYVFRSIIGDTPFMNGCHYWEITADPRTENELKVGLVLKKEFSMDTSFADYEFGYSFYGLGQLRHYSNSSGPSYGKRFKNSGVLGVYLDMKKGTLSFALNGEYFGNAYKSDLLKKGPIYPAISLLHQAGFKLEVGKPAPSYFL